MSIKSIRIPGWISLPAIFILLIGSVAAQTNNDIFFLPDKAPFSAFAKLPLLLGNGFTATGGDVTVKLVGNDASATGYLYALNPVTGKIRYLFRNKDAQGTTIGLGAFPKGSPVVFMYVADTAGLKPKKYTGANASGSYDFDGNPALADLAINHQAMPVSEEENNKGDNRWAVAARATCTDVVFGFEDERGGDYDYNDIVFLVTGVSLDSEIKLPLPIISGNDHFQESTTVTLSLPAQAPATTRIFYTRDGKDPGVSAEGIPQGSTREYSGPFSLTQDAVVKAIAWNAAGSGDSCGSTIVYAGSEVASATFSKSSRLDPPTFTPPSGTLWSAGLSVTITQSQGAEIHYVICALKAACADPDSSSPGYLAPISLSAPSQVKARAYKTGSTASDVSTALYGLNLGVTSAVYLDENGDGRIDAARITLAIRHDGLPVALTLIDPFQPGDSVRLTSAQMSLDPGEGRELSVRFPDQPFRFGTSFPDGPYGRFPSGPDSYDSLPFVIRDGVGPVVVSAEARPSRAGAPDQLRVVFSEDVLVDAAGNTFPFPFSALHPDGREFGPEVVMIEAQDVGNRTVEFTLQTGSGPQPGDSLKLVAGTTLTDLRANKADMGYYVPVGGRIPIFAEGGGFVTGETIAHPSPLVINVSVVENTDPASHRSGECLDCRTGEWKKDDPARPGSFPVAPVIKISVKGAFGFDLKFFDHLGQFVNRAEGKVTESMLRGIQADSLGYKAVGLMWYPVSEKGQQVGTGVYIAQGSLFAESVSTQGPKGGAVRITGGRKSISLRMGYLR